VSFLIRVRSGDGTVRLLGELDVASLEEAYLDACAAIPDAASQEIRERRNPFRCAFIIGGLDGTVLLEVPFTDLLSPSERGSGTNLGRPLRRSKLAQVNGTSGPTGERIDRARQLRSETLELRRRAAIHIDRSCQLIRRSRAHMFS